MPNNLNRPTVHAVCIEQAGCTFLTLWSDDERDEPTESGDRAAYYAGRLIPSARPVRPVRCYEGARS